MSTRAVIAQRTEGDKWEGVYNHFDGYPSGLGRKIWDNFQKIYAGETQTPEADIKKFIEEVIKGHSGGWSTFPDACYCHTRGETDSDMRIDSENPDPLFHEYVYILNPEKKEMAILSSVNMTKDFKPNGESDRHKVIGQNEWGKVVSYGTCSYGYKKIADINLLGEQPNWDEIEKTSEQIEAEHEEE